jgi:outer membrane lipopolysaccharide assembly protein LptE/RlpB
MKTGKVISLFIILCLLYGCGHELVRDRGVFGGEVISLSVPVFKNNSYEPQTPEFFTAAFSHELASSGRFDLNRPGADSVLQGTIESVSTRPGALSLQGQAAEKIVTVTVSLNMTRQGNPLKNWAFADAEAYAVGDINQEDFSRRQALQRIAARIARRFLSQLAAIY